MRKRIGLTWGNREDIRNAIMKLGSENAYEVDCLLVRIKYLEDSNDILPNELYEARIDFLKRLEDMVEEDRIEFEKEIGLERSNRVRRQKHIDGRSAFE